MGRKFKKTKRTCLHLDQSKDLLKKIIKYLEIIVLKNIIWYN